MKRTRRRWYANQPPVLGLLAAAPFVTFFIAQSPHLVHHLFDSDDQRTACPFEVTADHAQGPLTEPILVLPDWLEAPAWVSPAPALDGQVSPSRQARAPPLLAA